jgi:hypothetical protein
MEGLKEAGKAFFAIGEVNFKEFSYFHFLSS